MHATSFKSRQRHARRPVWPSRTLYHAAECDVTASHYVCYEILLLNMELLKYIICDKKVDNNGTVTVARF